MKYRLLDESEYIKPGCFLKAFGLPEDESCSEVISVVGAGGKTTLIETLASEYAAFNRKVVVTTTTHMLARPDTITILTEGGSGNGLSTAGELAQGDGGKCSLSDLANQIERVEDNVVYIAGRHQNYENNHKLVSPSENILSFICSLGYPILIEADGARHKLLKVPAAHEPVIYKGTTMVIGVMSEDAVGHTIAEVCHRPECVTNLLNKAPNDIIKFDDLHKIAYSDKGLKKSVREDMKYYVVISKDTDKRCR